ncbi:cystatin [Betta splendens]|uniref:Cystatin n=1 Tax=Betta splendens TaxID=158456 RepID=A0A6P7P032_BETSP|nr:cystatin [Betta splendens]
MYLPVSLLICLSVAQLSTGQQAVEEVIVARRVPLLGGWAPINPEARDLQSAAHFAVTEFNANSKNEKMFKLVSVIVAKLKVTNVIHYKFSAVLGKTKCLKSAQRDLESCNLQQRQLKCWFEVTFDPRNDQHEILTQKCRRLPDKDSNI